ncbi:hypothetical protein XANMN_17760 [Xanthomonas phaseoli pv. manihotis str. CIO151]|nr:hypothetical protein XANMN_17760 [Xanthomonas phaseoli pv. manihotis str. CIO151]
MLHLLDRRNAARGLPGLAVGSAQSPSQGVLNMPASAAATLCSFTGVHRRVASGADRQHEV